MAVVRPIGPLICCQLASDRSYCRCLNEYRGNNAEPPPAGPHAEPQPAPHAAAWPLHQACARYSAGSAAGAHGTCSILQRLCFPIVSLCPPLPPSRPGSSRPRLCWRDPRQRLRPFPVSISLAVARGLAGVCEREEEALCSLPVHAPRLGEYVVRVGELVAAQPRQLFRGDEVGVVKGGTAPAHGVVLQLVPAATVVSEYLP